MSKDPQGIRGMFGEIAPTYDRLNHMLSFNLDRAWRLEAARAVALQPGEYALDVCAGTLDLSLDLVMHGTGGRVFALDFTHPMLVRGLDKTRALGKDGAVHVVEGDALRLPVRDACMDAVTVAFGVRNLVHLESGLKEFFRVLVPGGRLVILEFSHPRNPLFRFAYRAYSRALLPLIGRIVSGHRSSYSYLPESVAAFADQDQLADMIRGCGFGDVTWRNLTFGTVALHAARRPE